MVGEKKRILVAPLNWGLGHASRCIPLIELLLEHNAEVLIAAEGQALALLKHRFPELETISIKGVEISYSSRLPLALSMLVQLPGILWSIRQEQKQLNRLIKANAIDGVISDNRYGLHTSKLPSVFICHQLFVKSPFLSGLLKKISKHYISKYSMCWVPDFKGENNLSGELSHLETPLENTRFIGPLSRFNKKKEGEVEFKRQIMVILSGPEPSRSMLEKKLLEQLKELNGEVLFVRGKPEAGKRIEQVGDVVEMVSHLPSEMMQKEMERSRLIICRSGYSSIMDLTVLGKKALLIPTKGQTEQEYLAKYHKHRKNFYAIEEDQINLSRDIEKALEFPGILMTPRLKELNEELKAFLKTCKLLE